MNNLKGKLEQIRAMRRHSHHEIIHHVHREHRISRKTLFYIKEYGEHSNIPLTIIRESIGILVLASVVSSIGGFAVEGMRESFIRIVPLIIIFPALNGIIGDYGIIISSHFSTMLHEGKIGAKWWSNKELHLLLIEVLVIAFILAVISAIAAIGLSAFSGFGMDGAYASKIFAIVVVDVMVLVTALYFVSVLAGLYFFGKGEDPNNFLIPITTSIADFGNMVMLSGLALLFL